MSQSHFYPLWQLVLCRIRVFYRQPEAVFWTYGFPLVMLTALGLAFREESRETILVDVVGPQAESFESHLANDPRFKVKRPAANEWRRRLQTGKTNLVVETGESAVEKPRFWFEPYRAESVLARESVKNSILQSELPPEAADFGESHLEEVGSRYIDFLLPGMVGMNLMGGGMWGIGFVVVDMRVRKLLKRLQATPMRRSDFLFSLMLVRLIFAFFDMGFLTLFGHFAFGVQCRGSLIDLAAVMLIGGAPLLPALVSGGVPGADDRNDFGVDEPGDAAHVDPVGRVLFRGPISRCHTADHSGLTAYGGSSTRCAA